MRRATAIIAAAIVACALAACVQGKTPAGPTQATPLGSASSIRLVAEKDADLHLWVSNQSFADATVEMTVSIDGINLIAQPFEVLGQHNWKLFPIAAPPGEHVINVISGTGTTMRQNFTLSADERRYAVVNYWYYPGEGGRQLSWHIQSTPVGFD